MYNKVLENPSPFSVLSEMEEAANNTDAEFSLEETEVASRKGVLEVPKTGGSMTLYVDDQGDGSYFILESGGDDLDVQVSGLSRLEFDVRPEDRQFRVLTFGETGSDFGL